MLTKRTQILFDEKTYKQLSGLAKIRKTSIGNLVRTAVVEKYPSEQELEKRRTIHEAILRHRPKPFKGKIDYKALINDGRKVY